MGRPKVPLPPKKLRLGGPQFSDDAYFLESARREADRLLQSFGLRSSSRLLDVGCGVGRLAIGIIDRLGAIKAYRGVDVDPRYVEWCHKHIERAYPTYQFIRVDVGNPRYNPGGPAVAGDFRHPFDDGSFEIIYLYSVFSHMAAEPVRIYLRDFRRLLASNGRLFFTAFAEEGVPRASPTFRSIQRAIAANGPGPFTVSAIGADSWNPCSNRAASRSTGSTTRRRRTDRAPSVARSRASMPTNDKSTGEVLAPRGLRSEGIPRAKSEP